MAPPSDDPPHRTEEILSALASPIARRVVHYFLDGPDDVATGETLASHVVATGDIDEHERAHIVLHHSVLPSLADAGIVQYDARSGTIRYESHPFVERCFKLVASQETGAESSGSESMPRATDRDPVDILLVEDNPGDIRLIREAFRDVDVRNTLHVVSDGSEAIDFWYQRGAYVDAPRPDIILLDLHLPQMRGDEVLDTIAGDREFRRTPVIILSGSSSDEDVSMSYDHGANAYLTKPVEPDEFMTLIQSVERFWLSDVQLSGDSD